MARVTHGPGIDDPLLRITASKTQYYHADGLGSIIAVTNPDASLASTSHYDAWGDTIGGTGSIPRYGYTGREPDAETGLVYYRARYYDPCEPSRSRDSLALASGSARVCYEGQI